MTRTWFRRGIMIALLALTPISAFAQIAAPLVKAVPDRSADIPFELYRGNRIFLTGKINGVDTPMVLDSGAGVTAIDRAFARRLGLAEGVKITAHGTGGKQDAELVKNIQIEVGNLQFSGGNVAVLDLAPIEKSVGRPIPVILGRELFMNSIVAIDFDRRLLSLSPAEDYVPPAGATLVPLKRDGTLHYLPIAIDGLPPVDAAFDLGNGGVIGLSKEYHEANSHFAGLPYALGMGGGVGGTHEIKRVTLPKIEIAGFAFTNVPADLGSILGGPHPGKANAGIQLFKPFRLTLDLGHDRLWLQRTAAPAVFQKDRAGLFLALEGDHFNILYVTPGSPADRAGLKTGDHLIAIGGEEVGPEFYTSKMSDWSRGTAGTRVVLTKSDGRTIPLTLTDYY